MKIYTQRTFITPHHQCAMEVLFSSTRATLPFSPADADATTISFPSRLVVDGCEHVAALLVLWALRTRLIARGERRSVA
jgi:hypothetical protein